MNMFVLTLLILSSAQGLASAQDLLEVDPYSIDSVEKHFPKAVQTETVMDVAPHDHKKRIGPRTKEIKRVDYQVLIPHLIAVIKDQQREIEKLKVSKMRNE